MCAHYSKTDDRTIEMLLALFTLLGQHGWTTVGPMLAGLGKVRARKNND